MKLFGDDWQLFSKTLAGKELKTNITFGHYSMQTYFHSLERLADTNKAASEMIPSSCSVGLPTHFQEPIENVGHSAILRLLTENWQFNSHFNYLTEIAKISQTKSYSKRFFSKNLK